MANFTAADVKKLRDLTGAGMMDCKKALDGGRRRLRQGRRDPAHQGRPRTRKRGAERAAAAGLVAALRHRAGRAQLRDRLRGQERPTSSTLAQQIADAAAEAKPADAEALKAVDAAGGTTVGEVVEDLAVKIGEKIELGRFAVSTARSRPTCTASAPDLPPQVGVLVEYDGDRRGGDAARGAAMQIAAMRPQYLTRDEVPPTSSTRSARSPRQTAREEGKPEQAIPKIIEGRLNGFFKDVVLLEQPSVTDNKKSVKAGPRRGRHQRQPLRPVRGRRRSERSGARRSGGRDTRF